MPNQPGQKIFRIYRFSKGQAAYYKEFRLIPDAGMTVLEGLFHILEKQDPTLSFRYSCRGAVCGSCAMYINGRYRLACNTMVDSLKGEEITISPLPHLPVIKDLVVDMTSFFERIEKVMPFLRTLEAKQTEILQSAKDREKLDIITDCILCAACFSSCPVNWMNSSYLGPAALNKAYRFLADSRDNASEERLSLLDNENGIWRCHGIFNCAESCPKKINPANSIIQLRRQALAKKLKFRWIAK